MPRRALEFSVNPEILKWARESSGIDHQKASQYLKLNADTIKEWESGKNNIKLTQLEKLANFYKRPLATFFLPSPPQEPSLPKDFRVLPDRGIQNLSKDARFAIRKARALQSIATDLMQELGIKTSLNAKNINLKIDPEDAAIKERNHFEIDIEEQFSWNTPHEAFNNWRTAFEEIPVFIFQMRMPLGEARGFSLSTGGVPVIVVNLSDSISARIFTIFHEYAHILLGEESICLPDEVIHFKRDIRKEEIFCNHFSGAFLVPKETLKRDEDILKILDYGEIGDYYLNGISNRFKVSKEVILRRMLISKIISQAQYQHKQFELESYGRKTEKVETGKKKGFGQLPHKKCLMEKGNLFVNLVFEAKEQEIISNNEMIDYLSLKLKYTDELKYIVKRK